MLHLDSPIYYPGALERPLVIQTGPPLALLFTSCDIACQFPSIVTDLAGLEVQAARDWRAKEGLFKGVILLGIEVYLLDPHPGQPHCFVLHSTVAPRMGDNVCEECDISVRNEFLLWPGFSPAESVTQTGYKNLKML